MIFLNEVAKWDCHYLFYMPNYTDLYNIGEGNGNPLQYSCLENPIDKGAWRATVHEVRKSQI